MIIDRALHVPRFNTAAARSQVRRIIRRDRLTSAAPHDEIGLNALDDARPHDECQLLRPLRAVAHRQDKVSRVPDAVVRNRHLLLEQATHTRDLVAAAIDLWSSARNGSNRHRRCHLPDTRVALWAQSGSGSTSTSQRCASLPRTVELSPAPMPARLRSTTSTQPRFRSDVMSRTAPGERLDLDKYLPGQIVFHHIEPDTICSVAIHRLILGFVRNFIPNIKALFESGAIA